MFRKFVFIFTQICFVVATIYYMFGYQKQFEWWGFLALFNYITYNNIT